MEKGEKCRLLEHWCQKRGVLDYRACTVLYTVQRVSKLRVHYHNLYTVMQIQIRNMGDLLGPDQGPGRKNRRKFAENVKNRIFFYLFVIFFFKINIVKSD